MGAMFCDGSVPSQLFVHLCTCLQLTLRVEAGLVLVLRHGCLCLSFLESLLVLLMDPLARAFSSLFFSSSFFFSEVHDLLLPSFVGAAPFLHSCRSLSRIKSPPTPTQDCPGLMAIERSFEEFIQC